MFELIAAWYCLGAVLIGMPLSVALADRAYADTPPGVVPAMRKSSFLLLAATAWPLFLAFTVAVGVEMFVLRIVGLFSRKNP